MRAFAGIAFTLLLSYFIHARESGMNQAEINAIKQVIQTSYVDGVHTSQDIDKIRSGFHDEFRMMVLDGAAVKPVRVEDWLARVEQLKADNPDVWKADTELRYDLIDVTGRCAVAKMHVYKGAVFFSTDYMFLYRIGDEWTIVSKVFVTEPVP